MARRFGITTPINTLPSMVLGSSEVRLIDITRAFAVHPRTRARLGDSCRQLVLADHRADLPGRHAQQLGDLVPVEPLVHEGGEVTVGQRDVTHALTHGAQPR